MFLSFWFNSYVSDDGIFIFDGSGSEGFFDGVFHIDIECGHGFWDLEYGFGSGGGSWVVEFNASAVVEFVPGCPGCFGEESSWEVVG